VKLALITGATGGLGKALSHVLVEKGFSLILSARNPKELQALADELGRDAVVQWIPCDLAKDFRPLLDVIEEMAPELIINNAGFGFYGPFDEEKELDHLIKVNLTAPLSIMQKAISVLKSQRKKGTILNVGSAAGYFSFPYFASYSAFKGCLRSLSEAVDEELQGSGIRVLVSCPGQIDTPFRLRASKGAFSKKQYLDIPVKQAAEAIYRQIETGKRVIIIDWKYRLAIGLARLLPKRWVQRQLAISIQKRIR
jgi:uncharacterized protein